MLCTLVVRGLTQSASAVCNTDALVVSPETKLWTNSKIGDEWFMKAYELAILRNNGTIRIESRDNMAKKKCRKSPAAPDNFDTCSGGCFHPDAITGPYNAQ